jgi:hypothetical protein
MDKHAAAAAGGIVDGVARLRFEHADEGVHDLGWGKELTRLGSSVVSVQVSNLRKDGNWDM